MVKVSNVGGVIAAARERAGLSLTDLANLLGWDKSRLSKYENNKLAISVESIDEIAIALKLQPELLLLQCLETKYPNLRATRVGKIVSKSIKEKL